MEFKSRRHWLWSRCPAQPFRGTLTWGCRVGGLLPAQGRKGLWRDGLDWGWTEQQRCGGGTEMACPGTDWERPCASGNSVSSGWRDGGQQR